MPVLRPDRHRSWRGTSAHRAGSRPTVAVLLVLSATVVTLLSGPSAAAHTGHIGAGFSASVAGVSPHGDDWRQRLPGSAHPAKAIEPPPNTELPPPAAWHGWGSVESAPPVPAASALPPWSGRAPPLPTA